MIAPTIPGYAQNLVHLQCLSDDLLRESTLQLEEEISSTRSYLELLRQERSKKVQGYLEEQQKPHAFGPSLTFLQYALSSAAVTVGSVSGNTSLVIHGAAGLTNRVLADTGVYRHLTPTHAHHIDFLCGVGAGTTQSIKLLQMAAGVQNIANALRQCGTALGMGTSTYQLSTQVGSTLENHQRKSLEGELSVLSSEKTLAEQDFQDCVEQMKSMLNQAERILRVVKQCQQSFEQ